MKGSWEKSESKMGRGRWGGEGEGRREEGVIRRPRGMMS